MKPAPPRHPAGQALLETLVAVAILAIALVSLLAGLVRLQDRRLEAAQARQAAWLAETKMAELELAGEAAWKNSAGDYPAPNETFSFAVEVTPSPDAALRLLSVTVRAAGSDRLMVRLSRLEPRP
ncbi:type IV pilus modification PilV family protein [Solidesulfovibrio sp.]